MTRPVNIIRSRPRTRYTKLPNALANDKNLSARALGVLYYILTKPPDWRVHPKQIASRFGMSYRMALKIMRELIDAGYVRREVLRDGRRFSGKRYVVADEPWAFPDAGEGQATPDRQDEENVSAPQVHAPEKGENRDMSILQHAEKQRPYKGKKDNKTPIPKTLSPAARVTAAGSAGKTKRRKRNKPIADRGRWEVEVAKRIGANGFDILGGLPDTEIDHLCLRQRRGTLDEESIARLRLLEPP